MAARQSTLRLLSKEEAAARCGSTVWDSGQQTKGWGSEIASRPHTDAATTVTRLAPGGGFGGISAPPTEFVLRMRKEVNTADAANARLYGTMDIGFRPPLRPVMDEAPVASRDKNPATFVAAPDFFQQGGQLPTKGPAKPQKTDAPTVGGVAPTISGNPFFGRMDISQDPRNVIREARSGVTENNFDVDVYLNNRVMTRENVTRFIPDGGAEPGVDVTLKAYESLRAQNSTYIK